MAKYEVLNRCFLQETRASGPRIYEPGEIIEYDGVAGENLKPVGAGPHQVAPRKFDNPAWDGIPLIKRAELSDTTRPMNAK